MLPVRPGEPDLAGQQYRRFQTPCQDPLLPGQLYRTDRFRLSGDPGDRGRLKKRCVFTFTSGDKERDDALLSPSSGVKESDRRKHRRTDKIHKQIFHGIQKADIQITAQPQRLLRPVTVDEDHVRDIADPDRMVASGRIQHHAAERMEDRILLHIQSHKLIHKAFKKLPHNSHRHRETERYHGEKERRQIKGKPVIVVEKQNKRKAYRRTEESVQRMQDRVPSGDHDVKSIDLSQDLRGKNKTKNRNLQSGGNLDPQFHLYPAWYIKQQK